MQLNVFKSAIAYMVKQRQSNKFIPILESDMSAFVFHALLTKTKVKAAELHVDSRLHAPAGNEKYDLLIGPLIFNSKSKPTVAAKSIVEIKIFADGFSHQQKYRRFHGTLKDIKRLGALSSRKITTFMLLYDAEDYLSGKHLNQKRLSCIVNCRNTLAPSVHIAVVHNTSKGWKLKVV